MNPTSLVRLVRLVDTHVHCIAARRAVKREKIGMTLKEWGRIYDRLLRFAGTPHAKRLIKYAKD